MKRSIYFLKILLLFVKISICIFFVAGSLCVDFGEDSVALSADFLYLTLSVFSLCCYANVCLCLFAFWRLVLYFAYTARISNFIF